MMKVAPTLIVEKIEPYLVFIVLLVLPIHLAPVAQFRLDTETLKWSLYCCDHNSKWHLYEGIEATTEFEGFLVKVDKETTGIFWG